MCDNFELDDDDDYDEDDVFFVKSLDCDICNLAGWFETSKDIYFIY